MNYRHRLPKPRFLPPGEMNKTEQRYAALLEATKRSGEIVEYRYEAVKFKLAPNTFYTPDFMVIYPDRIEFHEIKGFQRDDAMVKFKAIADKFPEFVWKMLTLKDKQFQVRIEI